MENSIEFTVDKINTAVSKFTYLEGKILSLTTDDLTLSLSEDLIYFNDIIILFKAPFFISLASYFKIDPSRTFIKVLVGKEAFDINAKFGVEIGNTLFAIYNEDGVVFTIAARDLVFINEMPMTH